MSDNWRTDGHYPGLIVSIDETDFSRVGNCWMNGRLKKGDLAMVLSHSGDCFFDYALVATKFWINDGKEYRPDLPMRHGYRLIQESKFGAYTLGTTYKYQPTTREYHLLMAGETTTMEADQEVWK